MLDPNNVTGNVTARHPDGFAQLTTSDQKMLLDLQKATFNYFMENTNGKRDSSPINLKIARRRVLPLAEWLCPFIVSRTSAVGSNAITR